jgi:hypothetical protein
LLTKKLLSIGQYQAFNIVCDATAFLFSSAVGDRPDRWFDAEADRYFFVFNLGSHFTVPTSLISASGALRPFLVFKTEPEPHYETHHHKCCDEYDQKGSSVESHCATSIIIICPVAMKSRARFFIAAHLV